MSLVGLPNGRKVRVESSDSLQILTHQNAVLTLRPCATSFLFPLLLLSLTTPTARTVSTVRLLSHHLSSPARGDNPTIPPDDAPQ